MAKEGKTELTFDNYRKFLVRLLGYGYEFLTHLEYMELPPDERSEKRAILLRHDVDLDREMRATERLARIETGLGISATVFLRLHDPAYNVLGYRELKIIRDVLAPNHEVGLHCETADLAKAIGGHEVDILEKDLEILRLTALTAIRGVAAHGDFMGIDNHWPIETINLDQHGLVYHAHQKKGWYISNYNSQKWKRYVDGILQEAGEFDFMQYADTIAQAGVDRCTWLIHPVPWCDVHYLSG